MSDRSKVAHFPVESQEVGIVDPVDAMDEAAAIRRADELRGEVLADLFVRLGRGIRSFVSRAFKTFERAQTMRALAQLDDRTLADIGLSRSDIPAYVMGRLYGVSADQADLVPTATDRTRRAA